MTHVQKGGREVLLSLLKKVLNIFISNNLNKITNIKAPKLK